MADLITDPLFWALVSMLGMLGAISIFSGSSWGKSRVFVGIALTLVTVGRVLLVLPFCEQPRFTMGGWHPVVGTLVMAVSFGIGLPSLRVAWWAVPVKGMRLRTTGVHALVRHPMYLCEVLWFLGWAILFRSLQGLLLAPVFWLAFLLHTLAEEACLERELGAEYTDYMRKVRGRIIPGLPF